LWLVLTSGVTAFLGLGPGVAVFLGWGIGLIFVLKRRFKKHQEQNRLKEYLTWFLLVAGLLVSLIGQVIF
jgi:hypothetical protein